MSVSTIIIPAVVNELKASTDKSPSLAKVVIGTDYPLVECVIWSEGVAAQLEVNKRVLLTAVPKIKKLSEAIDGFPYYDKVLGLDVNAVYDLNTDGVEAKNTVILVGKASRVTQKSDTLTTLTLLVRNPKKDESDSWFNCNVWNPLNGIVNKYVKDNQMIGLSGEFTWKTYENKEGETKAMVAVNARNLELFPKEKASNEEIF